MAKYATRTCVKCGIRKPQPHMNQKEIYVESGRSRAGVSKSTILASLLGDKKANKQVNGWLWNTNQRTYQRKRLVWVCDGCYKSVGKKKLGFWETMRVLLQTLVYLVIGFIVLVAIAGG